MDATGQTFEPGADRETLRPEGDSRLRWFELGLVILVAFGGPLFTAVYSLGTQVTSTLASSTNGRWAYDFVHAATALLLLAYVLSRRGADFRKIGLRWSVRDVAIGAPLVIISYAVQRLGYQSIRYIYFVLFLSRPSYRPASAFFGHLGWFAVVFALFNPFFEELIVRAYLMTEIIEMTGSSALAVIVSVGVQSAYHLYYGWAGALSLACQFLVFSLYFARWRRALPLVVAHGFFDVYGIVRLMR